MSTSIADMIAKSLASTPDKTPATAPTEAQRKERLAELFVQEATKTNLRKAKHHKGNKH